MKIEIIEKWEAQEEREYPWIGIADNGDVVLFDAKKSGVKISGRGFSSFFHSESWRMDVFKKFEGTITLEND